jgi:hypothetical protein
MMHQPGPTQNAPVYSKPPAAKVARKRSREKATCGKLASRENPAGWILELF